MGAYRMYDGRCLGHGRPIYSYGLWKRYGVGKKCCLHDYQITIDMNELMK